MMSRPRPETHEKDEGWKSGTGEDGTTDYTDFFCFFFCVFRVFRGSSMIDFAFCTENT